MKRHLFARKLVLIAIILVTGAGIIRMLFVQKDSVGLLLIAAGWLLVPLVHRLNVELVKGAKDLALREARAPRDVFEIFPGRAEGYSGFTDYVAMCVVLNDDLMMLSSSQQFARTGFGLGFVETIVGKAAEHAGQERRVIAVRDPGSAAREHLGWLAYVQQMGTDNAGQSTANLHSALQAIVSEMLVTGPVTMRYWDKSHRKVRESLEASRTTPALLAELTQTYLQHRAEGEQLALRAVVHPKPA